VVLLRFNGHRWSQATQLNASVGVPTEVITDGAGGLWIPVSSVAPSCTMLRYSAGRLRPVALPVPRGMNLDVVDLAAVPGTARAYGAGAAYPKGGPFFTCGLILAHQK
jgi:hypothetical protein